MSQTTNAPLFTVTHPKHGAKSTHRLADAVLRSLQFGLPVTVDGAPVAVSATFRPSGGGMDLTARWSA